MRICSLSLSQTSYSRLQRSNISCWSDLENYDWFHVCVVLLQRRPVATRGQTHNTTFHCVSLNPNNLKIMCWNTKWLRGDVQLQVVGFNLNNVRADRRCSRIRTRISFIFTSNVYVVQMLVSQICFFLWGENFYS